MNCYKCNGLIVVQYDADLRIEEKICVNCGARPDYKPTYLDGRDRREDPLCQICHVNPRITYVSFRGNYGQSDKCVDCLTKERIKRSQVGFQRSKRMKNLRQKNTFLFC